VISITALLQDNYERDNDSNSAYSDDHEDDLEMMLGIGNEDQDFLSEDALNELGIEHMGGYDS